MNWASLSAISDTIAAIGVILSLIYVATQIRIQNNESRIASVHELNEAFRDAITAFQDPNLADVFSRGKDGINNLSEPERLQFISMFQTIFRVWEDAYHQHQKGRLNEQSWNAMRVQFSGYLSLAGIQRVWELRKQAFSEEFRSFVDSTPALEYVTG